MYSKTMTATDGPNKTGTPTFPSVVLTTRI